MYRIVRILRILIALIAMGVPTWALLAGYDSVFVRMQILTALLSGSAVCLVFWAAVALVYGRIYCSTVCPMGTFMDCVSAFSRKVRRKSRAYRHCEPSSRTRVVFLVVAFALMLSGSAAIPALIDPYTGYARMLEQFVMVPLHLGDSVLFSLSSLGLAALTAIIVVGFAWRCGRRVCNTFCPVGTLLGAASRQSVLHMDINTDLCINCGECERVCKSECINLIDHTVDASRCVVCFDCAAVCPNGAITYRAGRHRLRTPLMQPKS